LRETNFDVFISKAVSDAVIIKCKMLAETCRLFFLDLAHQHLFEVNVLLKGKITFL